MDWKIKNKCIHSLYVDGENIINPWGFETADSSAFFSLEPVGYRYQTLSEVANIEGNCSTSKSIIQMREGKWELQTEDVLYENSVVRKVVLTCLEDSCFMDFVMRFRFKKDFIKSTEIAGLHFEHRDTNIYYQYPVEKVTLQGAKHRIDVTIQDYIISEKMAPYMYIRDHRGEWVVHVRMLPFKWDKEVIKLCNHWCQTRPLPQWMSSLLLRSDSIKSSLWYRGERDPHKQFILRQLRPLACPIVRLKKGESLMWKVEASLHLYA